MTIKKPSARTIDNNGFMLAKGCRLSREGIYQYSAGQCGLPGDPSRSVNVYRPKEEVADPDSIQSMRLIPYIDNHTMMSGINSAFPEYKDPKDVGVEGVLSDNVYFDDSDGWLKGDLKVFARDALERILDGKDDLSLGFRCKFIPEIGEYQGVKYEVRQTRIRGNHLARVDESRVEGASVADSLCFDSLTFDSFESQQEENQEMNPEQLKALLALLPKLKEILSVAPTASAEPTKPEEEAAQAAAAETAAPGAEEAAAQAAETAKEPEAQAVETAPAKDPEKAADNAETAAAAAATADAETPTKKDVVTDVEAVASQIDALIAQLTDIAGHAERGEMDAKDNKTEPEIEAMDSKTLMKKFREDERKKTEIYGRASELVGAFDHSAMDSADMGVYLAQKLNIKAEKGRELNAVEIYLDGIDRVKSSNKARAVETHAMDSSEKIPGAIGEYLAKHC